MVYKKIIEKPPNKLSRNYSAVLMFLKIDLSFLALNPPE